MALPLRSHWYVSVTDDGFQVPGFAVSFLPTTVDPVIVGFGVAVSFFVAADAGETPISIAPTMTSSAMILKGTRHLVCRAESTMSSPLPTRCVQSQCTRTG
jgi:hypothetical protein